jgi:hypothetical protein
MKATISRLRGERDEWRNLAQCQQQNLALQEGTITNLENQITALLDEQEEAEMEKIGMFTNFHRAYDKLVRDLVEAKHAIARLKKSDRAKEKVLQRNLRLKATLQNYTAKATAGNNSSLTEALALANDRIEDLEVKGEALLEALERLEDCSESGEGEGEDTVSALEAETAFRGVLEDTAFKEQRERWHELLNGSGSQ